MDVHNEQPISAADSTGYQLENSVNIRAAIQHRLMSNPEAAQITALWKILLFDKISCSEKFVLNYISSYLASLSLRFLLDCHRCLWIFSDQNPHTSGRRNSVKHLIGFLGEHEDFPLKYFPFNFDMPRVWIWACANIKSPRWWLVDSAATSLSLVATVSSIISSEMLHCIILSLAWKRYGLIRFLPVNQVVDEWFQPQRTFPRVL